MTNKRKSHGPENHDADQSLFISDEVESNIASDVQSMMSSSTDAPAAVEGTSGELKKAVAPTPIPETDLLHHELLPDPIAVEEILPDEQALYHPGLSHPADGEVEKILSEAKAIDSTDTPVNGTAPVNIDGVNFETMVFEAQEMPPIQDYVDPSTILDSEEAPQEEAPVEEPPLPKRRPKMKKGYGLLGIPHILSTVIWLAISLAIGISLGRLVWVCAAEVLAFGRPDQEYVFTVSGADNIDTIAARLKNTGLIKYPELFKLYADLTDAEEDISVGTFTLNSKFDYMALVNAMSYHSPAREYVELLIPEGYTCAQIFALLEQNGVCSAAELEEYAANGEIKDRWFLEGLERGDKYCLEGYLAPDTYEFYVGDDPERVLAKFLDEFDDRFTDIMKDDFETMQYNYMEALYEEGYSSQYIEDHKLTVHDVLTLASIVQRETGSSSESFDIASVFYNRIAAGIELGSDATVYYAIGDFLMEHGELTKTDLETNSPYNTRKYKGIPPGPICNPGTYALYAALDPNSTSYKYFVYDEDARKHLFSETMEEHEQKCRELGLW